MPTISNGSLHLFERPQHAQVARVASRAWRLTFEKP
jgi:hypothetical protein